MAKYTYEEEKIVKNLRTRHVAVREDYENLSHTREISREIELLVLDIERGNDVRSLAVRNEQLNRVLALIGCKQRVRDYQNDVREYIDEICNNISVYSFGKVLIAALKKAI